MIEAWSLATAAMNASLSSRLHSAVGVSRVSITAGSHRRRIESGYASHHHAGLHPHVPPDLL